MASLTTMPSSRKKILVADDDPLLLATLSRALLAEGYEVATAASGSETISRVQESKPDLVLLDLDFPPDTRNVSSTLEDGFTIISWLRGLGGAAKTPIIIISGTEPLEYLERAQAAGVVMTFHKPVDHDRLLEVIRMTLDGHGLLSGSPSTSLGQQQAELFAL
jgi:CheY-like chemotaxis protein